MSMPRFEVFPGANGQWFFHLRGGNGEIMLPSEGYTRKADALRAVRAVRLASVMARTVVGTNGS